MAEQITIDDFSKLDIRAAKVLSASPHPNADRLIVLQVDIGGGETRQIVAGIRRWYEPDSLVGKTIVVLVNLRPALLRGMESQGMLLAASSPDRSEVAVLTPDREVPPGGRVS
jgi:methionine--tRNA ligase beta chain